MRWLCIAMSAGVIGRAVKVALVVGSVLNLVNQGSVLLSGDLASCLLYTSPSPRDRG